MRGFVTNKAGIAWIIGILIMLMALFTNADLTLAGDKKATSRLDGKGVKVVDAETGFDGMKWLKLYKSNGWDEGKYARPAQNRFASKAAGWSPDLEALHQKLVDQSKLSKLSDIRRSALRPFSRAERVSDLIWRGELKMPSGIQSAGTTTVLLNGSNPDTIQTGDSLEITVTLLGDTAWIRVFWDANNNQMIDMGDFDLFDGEEDNFIVDDSFEDEDPTAGTIKITLFPEGDDVFLLLANNGFLFEADDGAAADTASLWIESVSSDFSVSGNAGGYEGVVIFAESCSDEFCTDFGPDGVALTTTDVAGDYTLNLPTSLFGYWIVGAFDVFDVTGGLVPSPSDTTVFVLGHETGIDFEFITSDATIAVAIQDNNGVALEGVPIIVESHGFGVGLEDTTDASGVVSFDVIEGEWEVFADPDWLLPDYLIPFREHIFTSSGGVAVVNLVAYVNNDSIRGTTFLDNIATGGLWVGGFSELGYSQTESRGSGAVTGVGSYSLPVSSHADAVEFNPGYCVSVCHLSANQLIVKDGYNIPSGSISVDIRILTADGMLEGTVYDIDTGMPIEFAGVCAEEVSGALFNCAGTDESGYYEMPILNGEYIVGAFAEGYLLEVVGPVSVNNDTVRVDFQLEEGASVCYPNVWAVDDAENDQGRQVRVIWPSACLDFADITNYTLWRLVDDQSMVATVSSETQIQMSEELWDYIDEIPDVGFPEYSSVAPTLGDSISPSEIWWSTFMVIAHTDFDEVFLPGAPGSGYSVDNLIPDAPNLSGMLVSAGNELTWTEIVNEEAKYYTVYRSVNGGDFQPVENATATVYLDTDFLTDAVYIYFVTATDYANQEGLPSNEVNPALTGIDGDMSRIPKVYALDQNYPNPFNHTTRIEYQIPNSGSVSLKIYNLRGELVSTLVDEEMAAGYHSVTWNGLTSSGAPISSGVYLYRIQANDFVQVRKMIMMK